MSKFHSMVSRRDFMKGLGLAGAGLGAAAATAPVFHDLDEVMSSSSLQSHPWYVKERELMDPTTDVDWNMMERYDRREQGQCARVQARYYGEDRVRAANANSGALSKQQLQNNEPGFRLKWGALRSGFTRQTRWKYGSGTFSVPLEPSVPGDTVPMAKTPEELGVPKWTGTPEEASKMLVAAARLFGVGELGFAELDSTYRNKLVAVNHKGNSTGTKWIGKSLSDFSPSDARPLVYEDVPKGYATNDKLVIPTSPQWVVYLAGPEPAETDRTGISRISKSNLVTNSTIRNSAFWSTLNFLRTLGYDAVGGIGHGNDAFNSGAIAILTGKSETGRMSNWPISIAYGPRAYDFTQIVNLPLAPTHPVDAGIWRFCQTCGLCAEACPSGSIPEKGDPNYPDGPSYEMPLIEGKPDTQHAHGPKLFWYNGSTCRLWMRENFPGTGCSLCAAHCPFSRGGDSAMVHSIIKSTMATTGLFNSFFSTMSKAFGYGPMENKEDWWDMSLPMFGVDTTGTALHGGYRK
jgi:reductive dehalogenase